MELTLLLLLSFHKGLGSGDPPKEQNSKEQPPLHWCPWAMHPNLPPPSQVTSLTVTSISVQPGHDAQQQSGYGGSIHLQHQM